MSHPFLIQHNVAWSFHFFNNVSNIYLPHFFPLFAVSLDGRPHNKHIRIIFFFFPRSDGLDARPHPQQLCRRHPQWHPYCLDQLDLHLDRHWRSWWLLEIDLPQYLEGPLFLFPVTDVRFRTTFTLLSTLDTWVLEMLGWDSAIRWVLFNNTKSLCTYSSRVSSLEQCVFGPSICSPHTMYLYANWWYMIAMPTNMLCFSKPAKHLGIWKLEKNITIFWKQVILGAVIFGNTGIPSQGPVDSQFLQPGKECLLYKASNWLKVISTYLFFQVVPRPEHAGIPRKDLGLHSF